MSLRNHGPRGPYAPGIKSRARVLAIVIPRLKAAYPKAVVPRGALVAELSRAGIPYQPWLAVAAKNADGSANRGHYDLSEYYSMAIDAEGHQLDAPTPASVSSETDSRTDAEVDRYVNDKFSSLERMAQGVVSGIFRAVILSGPPGVGKSFAIENILAHAASQSGLDYERITTYSRATGLYKALYENRDTSDVILIDDCDSIFQDDISLSILKGACDSTAKRVIQWRSERDFEDELGEKIPRHFVYNGRIVFVTNLNFDAMSRTNGRLAPHLAAMMSRSFYVDLSLTPRETLARVLSVAAKSEVLKASTPHDRERICGYLIKNARVMREISIRSLILLQQIIQAEKPADSKPESVAKAEANFQRIANATLLRR